MSKTDAKSIEVLNADSDELFNFVFQIRTEVFVDESEIDQEDEYDGFDHLSHHYLAYLDGIPAGASRWRVLPGSQRTRVERIAVLKQHRQQGVGRALVSKMLSDIPEGAVIFAHVQSENQDFFVKLGFEIQGEAFLEAGIVHNEMILS